MPVAGAGGRVPVGGVGCRMPVAGWGAGCRIGCGRRWPVPGGRLAGAGASSINANSHHASPKVKFNEAFG